MIVQRVKFPQLILNFTFKACCLVKIQMSTMYMGDMQIRKWMEGRTTERSRPGVKNSKEKMKNFQRDTNNKGRI